MFPALTPRRSAVNGERAVRMSGHVNIRTHFGPPHSTAEARTIGNVDRATGSIVRELFSTALCTSWDSLENSDR